MVAAIYPPATRYAPAFNSSVFSQAKAAKVEYPPHKPAVNPARMLGDFINS